MKPGGPVEPGPSGEETEPECFAHRFKGSVPALIRWTVLLLLSARTDEHLDKSSSNPASAGAPLTFGTTDPCRLVRQVNQFGQLRRRRLLSTTPAGSSGR